MRHWREIPGFWEDPDPGVYEGLISQIPDGGMMVEVGSYRGRSLASVAPTLIRKKIKLVAVDIFGSVFYNEDNVTPNNEGMLKDFMETMREFQLDPLVIVGPVRLDSFVRDYLNPHLVFIDADHAYEAVKNDIKVWWSLVQPDGILAGHDYNNKCPGVNQAVDELPMKFEVNGYIWSVKS